MCPVSAHSVADSPRGRASCLRYSSTPPERHSGAVATQLTRNSKVSCVHLRLHHRETVVPRARPHLGIGVGGSWLGNDRRCWVAPAFAVKRRRV
eukprot:2501791-Alexandrium_andersonii.AAC.1